MRTFRASIRLSCAAMSAALAVLLMADRAGAGPAQRACLMSERSPGPVTCSCIQGVADQTLTPRDQRRAATIIANPDLMDKVLEDRRASARGFVERYRRWGEVAAQTCG